MQLSCHYESERFRSHTFLFHSFLTRFYNHLITAWYIVRYGYMDSPPYILSQINDCSPLAAWLRRHWLGSMVAIHVVNIYTPWCHCPSNCHIVPGEGRREGLSTSRGLNEGCCPLPPRVLWLFYTLHFVAWWERWAPMQVQTEDTCWKLHRFG